MNILLNKLINKENLTLKEAENLADKMMDGVLTPVQVASFLTALSVKGESEEEILGFIESMRKHMNVVKTKGEVIDTCGTGGDGNNTFNISTAVAFVVAGAGVKVAKHGNRSASSLCGSADVLEALGVNINLTSKQAEKVLEKIGLVFLFAPLFHPSMKHVGPVRKELKIRTIFNLLGPFSSPASVKRQIIGVPNKKIGKMLALVAQKLNYKHLMIVASDEGLDEISISAGTHVLEIKGKEAGETLIDPFDFGFKKVSLDKIKGGDSLLNSQIIKSVLSGEKGPKRDIVLLNAGAAFYVSGIAKSIKKGIEMARESIDKGFAKRALENLIKESQIYA